MQVGYADFLHLLKIFHLLLTQVARQAVEHVIDVSVEHGDRCAELVRDHGDEFALHQLEFPKPFGHPQPGLELIRIKRLGEEIIRSRVDGGHVVLLAALSREHDDVGVFVLRRSPNVPADIQAVHLRHHPI